MFRYVIYLLLLLSFSCTKKESSSVAIDGIDLILDRANDYSLPKSERVRLINQAEAKLNAQTANDSLYRERLFKLAGRYYNIEDYENYLRVVKRVYGLAKQDKDNFALAKGLHYIADYHYSKFKNDSAYYYFTKAEKKYDSLNNVKDLIRVKYSKADILLYEKDFSGAEVEIIKVLKIAKIVKDDRLIYDCYLNLGNALLGLNNDRDALKYYEKALNATNNLEADPQFAILKPQALNYIGKVYAKVEVYETAKQYYKAAMENANLKYLDPYLYSAIINNDANAEMKLGNFDQAEKMFFEALTIRKSQNNTPGIVGTYLNLGELYKAKEEKDKAVYYLNEAKSLAKANKIFEDELKSLKILTKFDLQNKSKLFERYIKLNDSLQNIERANRNKFARIEYETEEILNEKNIIQEEKEQISSQRWLILFSSGVLILFLGLLYNNKVQYTKNKQLQFEKAQQETNEQIYKLMLKQQTIINDVRQQEKKRISQELHDGIMSKLTSTRLNLFVLSKKNDPETIKTCLKHIDNIQNIEKELRDISHDLNKDSLLEKESFKVIISDLFEEYCGAINIKYQIEIDKTIQWSKVDSATKIHLYRILQECLQNIYKYSKATIVKLSIKGVVDRIVVDVDDNGLGFDTSKAKEGIGLKNMSSRVKAMNGEIQIYSSKEKGTHINLSIPNLAYEIPTDNKFVATN